MRHILNEWSCKGECCKCMKLQEFVMLLSQRDEVIFFNAWRCILKSSLHPNLNMCVCICELITKEDTLVLKIDISYVDDHLRNKAHILSSL